MQSNCIKHIEHINKSLTNTPFMLPPTVPTHLHVPIKAAILAEQKKENILKLLNIFLKAFEEEENYLK